jgi:hypothetical protein
MAPGGDDSLPGPLMLRASTGGGVPVMGLHPPRRPLFVLAVVLLIGACTPAGPPPGPPQPPLDPAQEALGTERATRLEGPVRVVFDWSLDEPGLRASGRGVARMEPPDRARLDLFARNGETVLRAAMVGDELRLPPGASSTLVPPPALFWSALGIFRPGGGSFLSGGSREGEDGVRLEYMLSGDRAVRYRLLRRVVQEVELLQGGQTFERLTLSPSPDARFPRQTVYRHLADFRELTFTLQTVDDVDAFPPDIWEPGR